MMLAVAAVWVGLVGCGGEDGDAGDVAVADDAAALDDAGNLDAGQGGDGADAEDGSLDEDSATEDASGTGDGTGEGADAPDLEPDVPKYYGDVAAGDAQADAGDEDSGSPDAGSEDDALTVGNLGLPCDVGNAGSDCDSGLCIMPWHLGGAALCAEPCVEAQCPEGFVCTNHTGEGYSGTVCIPPLPDKKTSGEDCESAGECQNGLCFNDLTSSYCSEPCVVGSCPSGFFCYDTGFDTITYCIREGYVPAGAPCPYGPESCAGGACEVITDVEFDEPRCTAACGSDGECPPNYGCGAGGFCVPAGTGKVSDPCELASECAAGICVAQGLGPKVCVALCDDGKCPDGTVCVLGPFENPYICVAAQTGALPLGAACIESKQCESGLCLPDSNAAYFCVQPCPKDDCPEGNVCKPSFLGGNACFPEGHMLYGGTCDLDESCAGGKCLLFPPDLNASLCTSVCDDKTPCPEGYGCDAGLGACLPQGTLAAGQPCLNDNECSSGACLGSIGIAPGGCGLSCASDGKCPKEDLCLPYFGPGGLAYFCKAPKGGAPIAGPCFDGNQCDTSICGYDPAKQAGACTLACPTGTGCPQGLACQVSDFDAQLCFLPGSTQVGDPCTEDAACASGICVKVSGKTRGYCSTSCGDDEDCDSAYACIEGECVAKGDSPDGAPCTSGAECLGGGCVPYGPIEVCGPQCKENDDCGEKAICIVDAFESACVPQKNLGEPCAYQMQCAWYPGGFCIYDETNNPAFCSVSCPPEGCPEGFVCGETFLFEGYCIPEL
jgi:hypothetical protein